MIGNEEFDKISKEFFYKVLDYNPIYGTSVGLHEYDDKMPSLKREVILEEIETFKHYLKIFEEMSETSLDQDRKLDRTLAIDIIKRNLFELDELRTWEKDPGIAELIGGSIFILFAKDFGPFDGRMKNIIKRLEKSPSILEDMRKNIKSPVKLWVEIAIESCQGLPGFFSQIENSVNDENKTEMKRVVDKMNSSLKEYVGWLKSLIPKSGENFAIGKEKFDRLLELRGLWKREEILELGETTLKAQKKKLIEICKRIDPDSKWEETVEKVKSEAPDSFEEALECYRKETQRAREFIKEKDLLTLPENEELIITETPEFTRHTIPFAALFPPAKFDKKQQSIYIVTPYEEKEMLKEHSYSSIINTSVHEAYPGHHVQLSCANTNDSCIRILSQATEFVEGWAHYCEELMREKKFSHDPKVDLMRTLDIIWRACRIIIDIKLSCNEMSFDEAVGFLVANTGMKEQAAIAEVKRYTQTPSYALSYLLGKHMIKELKKECKEFKGFSEKEFHDKMLYAESLPIKYQRVLLMR